MRWTWACFLPAPVFPHIGDVDFIIEVTDVAHHRAGLHGRQHVLVAYVGVARGGDNKIRVAEERLVDIGALSRVPAALVGDTTSKPSMHACMPQMGSISVTFTIIFSASRDWADPLPTSP